MGTSWRARTGPRRFRLPEEAAGASLLACGERRGDGASAATWPIAARWQWSLAAMEAYEPGERARAVTDDIGLGPRERVRAAAARGSAQPLAILFESGLARRTCGLVAPNPNEGGREVRDHGRRLPSRLGALRGALSCRGRPVQPGLRPNRARAARFTSIRPAPCVCYRVGLVVNCGIDLALWGAHRIEKLTSRLKVTDVLTENEVLAAVARPNSTLLERFDFLVSFEPLDVDFPSVTVSPGVSRSDVDHIIASVPLWRWGREVHTAWERGTLSVGSSRRACSARFHERLSADGLIDMPPARFERLVWTLSVVKDRTLSVRLVRFGRPENGHTHLSPGRGRGRRVRAVHHGRRARRGARGPVGPHPPHAGIQAAGGGLRRHL
ncbi:MAG: hypothetical protein ACLTDR_06635 [Adlercreutzia equolifaciens]